MYNGLLHAHSGFRYLVLITLVMVIGQSLMGWLRQRKYSNKHNWLIRTNVVLLLIQTAVGLGLFFMSSKVLFSVETMKSTILRFFTVEHPVLMIFAAILILISSLKAKPYSNYKTHKQLFLNHIMAFVLIIISIPWPFREQLGAGWF
ncbi:cytochrome B [Carboxylicivirga sp. M1479]|uniref:cytochrome B n=1 Tax=Carboxylicivirga sp. M1479 TaxID=2594476 RepID=UPI0011788063|nr:cytochrome B [Carboxylicivirga sp. M1479]TRX72285.1 cytochrome B [Carboxylicivirga sp. M1479]